MITQFITTEVDLSANELSARGGLLQAIEARLSQQGQPLRWAITAIDPSNRMATVEAVVTVAD